MPKATWGAGVSGSAIDNEERSDFKPYDGPIPPNQLFAWKITRIKKAKTSNDNPQLQVGLELVPRQSRPDDKPYKGYRIMDFIVVTPQTLWKVAPFLDAIGVSGGDFEQRTFVDKEGNIEKIGRLVLKGRTVYVLAMLGDNDGQGSAKYPKQITGYWAPEALQTEASAAKTAGRRAAPEPVADNSDEDDPDDNQAGYDDEEPPF